MTPKRIQRKRTRGWRMPESAIYVGRPSLWGNQFIPIMETGTGTWRVSARAKGALVLLSGHEHPTREAAFDDVVEMYRLQIVRFAEDEGMPIVELLADLRGHDLACFCPLDQPCHADILLEMANA